MPINPTAIHDMRMQYWVPRFGDFVKHIFGKHSWGMWPTSYENHYLVCKVCGKEQH